MSVEERIDELYALPPEEFVAARDELAKDLRASGEADAAAEVKALRRPSVAAWAVNQAARRDPEGVDELLAAGRELRDAQRRAMTSKGRTDVQGPTARRRAAVDRLAQAAGDVLEEAGRGSAAHLDAIADTFLAASVEDAVAELVRRGRLDRERRPSSDLADIFGLSGAQAPRASPGDASIMETEDPVEAERRAELEAAERRLERARREADRAAERAAQAEETARAAREHAGRLARAAKEAGKEAATARKEADAAERELERLRGDAG